MEKYNYNELLIEKLNLEYFIKKYNLENENYNKAIFCALSSIYEHQNKIENQYPTKSILLGDYYSFEYYSLLNTELDKLRKLTDVMKKGYRLLATKEIAFADFSREIIQLWLEFYNVKIDKSTKQNGENNVGKI